MRFTVRRMMVAVAVVALAFWLEMWRRRVPFCRQQALRCAAAQRSHLGLAASHERIAALYRTHPADSKAVVRYDIEQSVIFTLGARASGRRRSGRPGAPRRSGGRRRTRGSRCRPRGMTRWRRIGVEQD